MQAIENILYSAILESNTELKYNIMSYVIQFSNPVDASGNPASSSTPFQFQNATITPSNDTSTALAVNGFTYGEIFNGVLLLMLLFTIWFVIF